MNLEKENHFILIRQVFTKFFMSVLFSMVIFYKFNPKFMFYIIFISLIWCAIGFNYKFKKNSSLFLVLSITGMANLISLFWMKKYIHNTINVNTVNSVMSILYFLGLGGICIIAYLNIIQIEAKQDNKEEIFIYDRRKYDLDKFKKYLNKSDTVGITGIWGSGKTFLVNQLKQDEGFKSKYIYIDIDLLSCNLDEIQGTLLNEMGNILNKYRIFSINSIKLKSMFEENSVYRFLYMIFIKNDTTYSEVLNGFIKEIDKIDKKIMIIYEDIDRISDIDIIKKIFSISEKISNNNIKIIYQYDEKNLINLGLDRKYIEKYIQYTLDLTPVRFMDVIERVLIEENIEEKLLVIQDFGYLDKLINIDSYIQNELKLSLTSYKLIARDISIRKMRTFVMEVSYNLLKEGLDYKKIVISFYFIKHFFEELYQEFKIEGDLLKTLKFEYENHQYTIYEIISLYKQNNNISADKIFENEQNKDKLILLSLFEYKIDLRTLDKIENKKIDILEIIHSNEITDRLIRNLRWSGTSELTDYKNAAEKFINDVLLKPQEEQIKAYELYNQDMYNSIYYKRDNETIFKIGRNPLIDLSSALSIIYADEDYILKFIDFYFYYTKSEKIDLILIEVLYYCRIDSKKVYFYILEKFNKLNIIRNMNKDLVYIRFLKKYLRGISRFGYAETESVSLLDEYRKIPLKIDDLKDATKYIEMTLSEMKKNTLEDIKYEINVILKFICKNRKIINHNNLLEDIHPQTWAVGYSGQDEFQRLDKLRMNLSKDEFKKEVEESYNKNLISPYRATKLLEEI